jgi:hypothetical protein
MAGPGVLDETGVPGCTKERASRLEDVQFFFVAHVFGLSGCQVQHSSRVLAVGRYFEDTRRCLVQAPFGPWDFSSRER